MKAICTRCGGTNIACEAIVNPNTGKINSYKNDILVAGCHRIAYSEMKGIARQLGWD